MYMKFCCYFYINEKTAKVIAKYFARQFTCRKLKSVFLSLCETCFLQKYRSRQNVV